MKFVVSLFALMLISFSPVAAEPLGSCSARDWLDSGREILTRLGSADLTVTIEENSHPNAAAVSDREILISTGLLELISNENELAFVLAHEASHIALGHHHRGQANLQGAKDLFEQELIADQIAVVLVDQAGFRLHGAREILQKVAAFDAGGGLPLGRLYPSLKARLAAVQAQTEASTTL